PVQKNLAVAHSYLGRQDTALALTRNLLELDPRDERSRAMIDDEVLHLIIRLQQLVAGVAIVLGLVFGEDRDLEFLVAIPITFVLVLGSRLPQLPMSLAGVGRLPLTYLRDLMSRSWLVSVEAACFLVGVVALAGIPAFRCATRCASSTSTRTRTSTAASTRAPSAPRPATRARARRCARTSAPRHTVR